MKIRRDVSRFVRACFAAVFVLVPQVSVAGGYVVDFWDATRGLPGNSATSIAQTPEGYLWVGTYDGLARFDGLRFVRFDPSNTEALKHARVERLFTDPQGTLWINTHDGSLSAWRNGTFTSEWIGKERVESGIWLASSTSGEQVFVLQSGTVLYRTIDDDGRTGAWNTLHPDGTLFGTTFCVTRSGELWIRSRDERLWRVRRGVIKEVALAPLTGHAIRSLVVDSADHVVLATDQEIGRFNGTAFERVLPEAGRRIDVQFVHFTSDGDFWAVADGHLRKGHGQKLTLDAGPTRYLAEDALEAIEPVEDKRGGVWFAHGGRGLLHVDEDGAVQRFGPNEGFASGRVVSLFKDREDNVWASVDRGGLARLRERRFEVINVNGQSAGYATVSIAEDARGSVWLGSAGGGLSRFRAGVVTPFSVLPAARPFVLSLAPDAGGLWMSADREDLWRFDNGVARKAPFPLHGIKALLVDRKGRLWVGRRDGLARISGNKLEEFGLQQGMTITDIRALAEDSRGAIWIGGGDGSLHRYANERFETIDLSELPSAHPIWSLLTEPDGTVWAGTYQSGLLRIKNGRLTRYTTREGLVSDLVCHILDDQQGHLWIDSREGIYRVSKESLVAVAEGKSTLLSFATYGRADGIPPLECSGFQPGAWRATNGTLWFATTKGAVSVSPAELRSNQVAPSVVIEEVGIDRERRQLPVRAKDGDTNNVVIAPAGSRIIEFRYTGLSLAAPDAVRIRYRLQGLDPDFIDAAERRTAQYGYLPPGDYRFEVMARNSDGVWSEHGSSVSLRVLPHAWETWWFKTLLIVLALTLATGVARQIATRELRRNLVKLEQQRAIEHDRARIAKDIHDDLGAGLTQISLLSELLRDDRPQEAKAHVEQIGETAAELTRAMDEIVWAINPREDTLESLWDYLTHYAQEYLGTAGVSCRLQAPEPLPPLPLRAEVRHHVFLAVKEALHNVVKHAAATEVRLRLEPGDAGFVIEVIDNGRGRGEVTAPNRLRTSPGQGLRNLADRLASIGGACDVLDGPQGGTTVRLNVRVS